MYFLNLMLNAFSSILRLTQVTGDAGPAPLAPVPPGPGVPVPGAGGPFFLANGYPYVPCPGPVMIAPAFAPAEGIAGAGGAPPAPAAIPAPVPAPIIPAGFNGGALGFIPPPPAYAPAFGFSNYNLLLNNFITSGATEKWYQSQVAMYLQEYKRPDPGPPGGTYNFRREMALPNRIPGFGDVDFYLTKTNAGVNYRGYYELKVQHSNNINDLADLIIDFKKDMFKVIWAAQLAFVNGLANHEFVACMYLIDPRVLQLPGAFPLANLQRLSVWSITNAAFNPTYTNPYQNPAPAPVYVPVLLQQYLSGAVIPNPRRRNRNGQLNVPDLPGIVHFFQPYWVAGAGGGAGYQFVEVNQININIPLLCIYNGS